ncbi:uncharacterized protein LOC134077044 [Sardina pilchardus]|uniref:uncharacterized protein LOC134077044 n=1 Tax=Sardina pilchardus TaxID=27697 RepID=UPI002E0FD8D5
MAAATLSPHSLIRGELDVKERKPDELMADLAIPGYTWIYLSVPDSTRPGRNATTSIERAGKSTAPRRGQDSRRPDHTQQQGGDLGTHEGTPPPGKGNVNTATGVSFKLPRVLLTNSRSLHNKVEDLRDRIEEFQSPDLICLTETWLKDNSSVVNEEGYDEIHYRRNQEKTAKTRGGGLGVLIKNGVNVSIEDEEQTPNYQLFTFSYEANNQRPFYFILLYIQPGAKKETTKEDIERYYREGLNWSNRGPVFILGDFNWYEFEKGTLDVYQYVTCPTRINKLPNKRKEFTILDKCYGNIPEAYSSQCRPPLRSTDNTESDHNVILLIPERTACSHSQCETSGHLCDICERVCGSRIGLHSHKQRHQRQQRSVEEQLSSMGHLSLSE